MRIYSSNGLEFLEYDNFQGIKSNSIIIFSYGKLVVINVARRGFRLFSLYGILRY